MRRLRRLWQWLTSTPTCCECGTSLGRQVVWLDRGGALDWVCLTCAQRYHYPFYLGQTFEDL